MSTSLFYRFVVVLLTIVAVSMSGTVFGQQTTNPGEEEQPDFAVVEELLKELGTNNDPSGIAALLRSNLDRLNGATVAEFLVKLGGAPHDILMEDLGNAVENRPGSRPMEDILSDILDAQPDANQGGQYGPPPGTGQGNLAPFRPRGGKYGPPQGGDRPPGGQYPPDQPIDKSSPGGHYGPPAGTGQGNRPNPGGQYGPPAGTGQGNRPPGGQYPPDQPIDKSSPGGQYGTGQGNLPPAGQNPGNIYQPRGNQDVTPAGTGQGNRSNPFGMSSPVGNKYTAPIDYALVDELLNQIGDQRDPVLIVEVLMNNLVILASLQGGHQDKYMGGQGIPPTATEQYGPPPCRCSMERSGGTGTVWSPCRC